MTKAQLLAENARLRAANGLAPVGPPRLTSVPANATAVPWAQAPVTVPAATVAPAPTTAAVVSDRSWFDLGERGASNSGRPTIILTCQEPGGRFWRGTFPADAVRAIAHGKVLGADGKPVRF
ncbi:MAG TPA: hypothetical protein VLV48_10670 [Thermoanaerobaculia bacterium]|nr:hypothetical protein [Thermoanaerobaculia bacterium]